MAKTPIDQMEKFKKWYIFQQSSTRKEILFKYAFLKASRIKIIMIISVYLH